MLRRSAWNPSGVSVRLYAPSPAIPALNRIYERVSLREPDIGPAQPAHVGECVPVAAANGVALVTLELLELSRISPEDGGDLVSVLIGYGERYSTLNGEPILSLEVEVDPASGRYGWEGIGVLRESLQRAAGAPQVTVGKVGNRFPTHDHAVKIGIEGNERAVERVPRALKDSSEGAICQAQAIDEGLGTEIGL